MVEEDAPPLVKPKRCLETTVVRLALMDDAYSRYAQARAQSQTGKDKDAQLAAEEMHKLLLTYPWLSLTRRALGIIYGYRGNWIASYSWYSRYLERDIHPVDEANVAAEMRKLEDRQPALRHFAEAQRLHQAGQLDRASEQVRRAIAIKPQFALAHRELARLLDEQSKPHDAADAYESYVRLDPYAPDRSDVESKIQNLRSHP